jgi:hypothetical protein
MWHQRCWHTAAFTVALKPSFETLICRLFRDSVQFCSGLVDLVVGVSRHSVMVIVAPLRAIRRSCQVGLQQRLRGSLHRHTGQPAHVTKLGGQGIELLVGCGPQLGRTTADRRKAVTRAAMSSAAAGCRPPFSLGAGYGLVVVLVVALVR